MYTIHIKYEDYSKWQSYKSWIDSYTNNWFGDFLVENYPEVESRGAGWGKHEFNL